MLQLLNVKKSFNSSPVLQISSLQLHSNIYWLKGINGSGKTTLLKMIAGLLPFDGDILFKNINQRSKPVLYRQHISWAEAEPVFPYYLSGMALVSFYRSIRKASKREANLLLERFNMIDYINNATGTYSAGMTKKLSLVLAFLGNAPLIVLDEPFNTVDTESKSIINNFIIEKHISTGTTFLMTSHHELDAQLKTPGTNLILSNQTISAE
jgi:ABC-2 type transport system ATP-binding protein